MSKNWDGTVVDKNIEEYDKKYKDDEGHCWTEHKIYYNVLFQDTKGKPHKLVNEGSSAWYEYLNVGDAVRYHGKFKGYYEKYDKSRDEYIPCASCGMRSDVRATYCDFCGARLFKAELPVNPADMDTEYIYCKYCGLKATRGVQFCCGCGASLS